MISSHVNVTRLFDVIPYTGEGFRKELEEALVDNFTGYPKIREIQHVSDLRRLGQGELERLMPDVEPQAIRWLLTTINGGKVDERRVVALVSNAGDYIPINPEPEPDIPLPSAVTAPPKRRGRPKGSKNKPKAAAS